MRNIAQVLADIPAVPEGVIELAVAVAPEHVRGGLADVRSGRDGLREHGIGIGDLEGEDDRRAADRRRREHTHLTELVGQMHERVADPELDRHQPPVGGGYPAKLLGAERLAVEDDGALGVLNDHVRSDWHAASMPVVHSPVLNVLAGDRLAKMATEQVRMWRSEHEDRVLLVEGRTAQYAIEPRGEYVFGFVAGQPMRSRRGRERRLVAPGQIVAWDPSSPHSGAAVNGQPWSARLMVIEAADLATLAGDEEAMLPANVDFSEPVICDPQLIASFHRL